MPVTARVVHDGWAMNELSASDPRASRARARSPATIAARRPVAMDAEQLFALLSDIRNQWLLARPQLEPVHTSGPDSGEVSIKGPLGRRRSARTTLLVALDPHFLIAGAEIGPKTVARVCWALVPRRGTTEVELSLHVASAGALDRLRLALGGRRRLARHLDAALDELAHSAALAAEGVATVTTAGALYDDA
jgi:hypothetical protein